MGNVLVTGGTGFIGSHTVDQLLQRGYRVRCLVRPSRQRLSWLEGLPVEIFCAEFSDPAGLEKAVDGVEHIIHVAGLTKAKRRREFFETNVDATRNLLEAATHNNRLKKLCVVSSLTVVGPSYDGTPVNEESPCRPITAYGQSKLEQERICLSFGSKIPIVIIRPPTVYGPRDHDVLEAFRWVNKGIEPSIGASQKNISLIHGSDLARGIIDATFSDRTAGETYFVTDERIYKFKELVRQIAANLGKKTVSIRMPGPVVFALAGVMQLLSVFSPSPPVLNIDKARDLVQPHWVCTSKKIRDHIGFETRISLEQGFRETAEWYRSNGWL